MYPQNVVNGKCINCQKLSVWLHTSSKMRHKAYFTWTLRCTERPVIFHRGFSREEEKAHNSIIHFWSILWREKNEKRKWTDCLNLCPNNCSEWKKKKHPNNSESPLLWLCVSFCAFSVNGRWLGSRLFRKKISRDPHETPKTISYDCM